MPIVLDASVLAEVLLLSPRGARTAEHIRMKQPDLHLPHLADVETASVLRGLARGGIVGDDRAQAALIDLRDFPAKRWPATSFLERIWMLRENATAYDSAYIALAEALDAEFVTADAKLVRGVERIAQCRITLVQ
ncbi:MAG: type II toxin-antitoxin system VapC family toxin [Microbacterium sp.]|jgi:predicted nucleic acid-binding protein|nr:type II toxin-antitoxin system VapC family toxin [Microbacterium sp.]